MPAEQKTHSWPLKNAIAQTVTFGRDGNAHEFQTYGWAAPGDQRTWSLGKESGLILPAPKARFGYFLEIDAGAHTREPWVPHQCLTVLVNGKRVTTVLIKGTSPVAILCPPPDSPQIVITFQHPDAMSASEVSDSQDTRQLAIAFFQLRILSLTETVNLHKPRSSHLLLSGFDVASIKKRCQELCGAETSYLLPRFEMLAGDCTMGLAVRHLGEEPLSLLRFAGSHVRGAIRNLDSDFTEVGKELAPFILPENRHEWMMRDHAGLRYHTGRPQSETADQVIASERRKIGFLRRKLLEDLNEQRKIFVFDEPDKLDNNGALPLFLALRRHGPHTMLWSRPAGGADRGRVLEILPGLLRGGLSRSRQPVPAGIAVGGWLELFINAWQLVKEQYGSA